MATFKIRDLMINVVDERLKLKRAGTALCTQDQPTQLTCGRASPIMRGLWADRLVQQGIDGIKDAVMQGDPDGAAALQGVVRAAGQQLVGGALRDNGTFQPDPNCAGTSLETIPTPITPVVTEVGTLRAEDLSQIKEHIHGALADIEQLESSLAPSTDIEKKVIAEHLQGAMDALR